MPNDIEEWKTIEEAPRYDISNHGRVRSRIGEEKILKPDINQRGYLRVKLCRQPKEKGQYDKKDYLVHRLTAKYFCEDYADHKEIHHKDLDPKNNRADNLLCLTKAEHAALHKELRQNKEENGSSSAAEKESVQNNDNRAKLENDNGQ